MTFDKHIRFQGIHFSKWSNKSYAIFSTIGSVISIGNVTNIIGQLVTIKSTSDDCSFYSRNSENPSPIFLEVPLVFCDLLQVGLLEILGIVYQIRYSILTSIVEVLDLKTDYYFSRGPFWAFFCSFISAGGSISIFKKL